MFSAIRRMEEELFSLSGAIWRFCITGLGLVLRRSKLVVFIALAFDVSHFYGL